MVSAAGSMVQNVNMFLAKFPFSSAKTTSVRDQIIYFFTNFRDFGRKN